MIITVIERSEKYTLISFFLALFKGEEGIYNIS